MSTERIEAQLVASAAAGNREALSELLLLHYDFLRGHVARRISHDLQGLLRAEDVLHQAFVQAAGALHTFRARHTGGFRAWLRTIADNVLRDAEKRRRRERRVAEPAVGAAHGSSVLAVVEHLPADGTTPSSRVQRADNTRRVQAALAGLPAEQREVLERYYFQEQSLDEIALDLDRSREAVRGICYRARRNLRTLMGRSSLYFSG